MDYYRMKNIQADTTMRDNIAKPEQQQGPDISGHQNKPKQ
jgi:uncharacterized protein YqfA (UPF0365 family)